MVVHGDETLDVVEEHREPVKEIIAGLEHGARRRRGDRGPRGRGDVHAAVRLPRLVVQEASQPETAGRAPRRRQVEAEIVERRIAEGRKRPDDRFLVPRDPQPVRGPGVDLAGGERQVLHLVVMRFDVEADGARALLALEHRKLVRPRLEREREADDGVPGIAHARDPHALAVEDDLRSRGGRTAHADHRDPPGHRRRERQIALRGPRRCSKREAGCDQDEDMQVTHAIRFSLLCLRAPRRYKARACAML